VSRRRRNSSRKSYVTREPKIVKNDWKHDIKVSQDYICPVCGQKGTDSSMNIHHCKNKCKGGKNTSENCVAVHKQCHKWIHEQFGNSFYDPRHNQ